MGRTSAYAAVRAAGAWTRRNPPADPCWCGLLSGAHRPTAAWQVACGTRCGNRGAGGRLPEWGGRVRRGRMAASGPVSTPGSRRRRRCGRTAGVVARRERPRRGYALGKSLRGGAAFPGASQRRRRRESRCRHRALGTRRPFGSRAEQLDSGQVGPSGGARCASSPRTEVARDDRAPYLKVCGPSSRRGGGPGWFRR